MQKIKEKDNVPVLKIPKGYLRFGYRYMLNPIDGKTIVEICCSDTKSENIGANVKLPEDETLDPILYILLEDPLQADAFASVFCKIAKAMRLGITTIDCLP